MRRYHQPSGNLPARQAKRHNNVAKARSRSTAIPSSKRARGGQRNECLPFAPPEDWHEPGQQSIESYRVIVQPPGPGYRHIVSPDEVRNRLAALPDHFLRELEVVQLSRMTRKKRSFPCYGMQWGSTLYLYPLEDSLVEFFYEPPRPELINETKMYGGRWIHDAPSTWQLIWTEQTIKDFYLNNVLIHELGHLLDDRNANYADRERYAEWFAVHHGYRPTRPQRKKKRVLRRHHAKS